jgi:hypothetical protein
VRQAALDPQGPGGVEVPDVARAVAADPVGRVAAGRAVGDVQAVVPVVHVRGGGDDLARDAGLGRERAGRGAVGVERADADVDRVDGRAHADAGVAATGGVADPLERHVGEQQPLGHAVGRVDLGGRHQRGGAREQGLRERGSRGEQRPDAGERGAVVRGERVGGRDDVRERRRRREDDRGVGRAGRGCEGGRGEVARPGHVHVGRDARRAERGAQQRERREARDEPGADAHVEAGAEGVPEGGQLAVRVDHALGGSGGSRGEEDRGVVVRRGLGRQDLRAAVAGDLRQARGDAQRAGDGRRERRDGDPLPRPAEGAREGEAGGDADDHVGAGSRDRAPEALHAESGVGDHDDRADAEARVEEGGEVGARRYEQRDAVARTEPAGVEARRDLAHAARQQPPGDGARTAGAARGHLDEDGGVAVAQLLEERAEEADGRGVGGGRPSGTRGGRRSGRDPVRQPVERGRGVVVVLGDEVPGALDAVHVGVRQALEEVGEVDVAEDRVARSPDEQGRQVEVAEALGDGREGRVARVRGAHRDVGDEAADPRPAVGAPVRRRERATHGGIQRRVRERERGGEEAGRAARGRVVDPRGEREPQRPRDGHALLLVHGRVQRHDPGEHVAVAERPAEADDAAPVVAERDDATRGAGSRQPELVGERLQVVEPDGQRARDARAFGEAHVELVDGDHAPGRPRRIPLGARQRLRRDAPPQVRPGRVAVHAQDRAGDGCARGREPLPRVDEVPAAPAGAHDARPGGIEAGQRLPVGTCRGDGRRGDRGRCAHAAATRGSRSWPC